MREIKGGFSDYFFREPPRPRKKFKPSCGYVAIANLLGLDIDNLKTRFKEKIEEALSCQDIMKIVAELSSEFRPDCRFCSMKRTTLDLPPLLKGMTGIVALKEKKGNASHWLFVDKGGDLTDAEGEVFEPEEIQTKAKFADGYGHKVVFWDAGSYEFLDNAYLTPQRKENCSKCSGQPIPQDNRRAISF